MMPMNICITLPAVGQVSPAELRVLAQSLTHLTRLVCKLLHMRFVGGYSDWEMSRAEMIVACFCEMLREQLEERGIHQNGPSTFD